MLGLGLLPLGDDTSLKSFLTTLTFHSNKTHEDKPLKGRCMVGCMHINTPTAVLVNLKTLVIFGVQVN